MLWSRCELFVFISSTFALIFATSSSRTNAACPQLDNATFELVTNVRRIRGATSIDIRLEERYSGEQSRGIVNFRAYGLSNWSTAGTTLKLEAGTFFHDAQENISLLYNDGTGSCRQVDPIELLRLAGMYFVPKDEKEDGGNQATKKSHLIGSARWLKYFCERRSELVADLTSMPYNVRNVPSRRYTTSVMNDKGKLIEAVVYYRESSLTPEKHDSAMPNRIAFSSPQDNLVTVINVSPVKFATEFFESPSSNENRLTSLESDTFLLVPPSCYSLIFNGVEHQPIFDRERIRRVSFTARVTKRHGQNSRSLDDDSEFMTQVAYDGYLNTMRVDLVTPEQHIKCSKQIFNFYRNKQYHILEQDNVRNALLDYLLVESRDPDSWKSSQQQVSDTQSGASLTDSSRSSACAIAQVSFTAASWHQNAMGQLLLGSDAFVYLGRARVRGIRALVYVSVGSNMPFWLETPVDVTDTTGSADRAEMGRRITLLYVSEISADRSDEDSQILLMEIYHMDPNFKLIYDKHTVAIHDFSWSLQSIKSICESSWDDDDSTNNPASLFSVADSCSDVTNSASQQEHGHFEMLLESYKAPSIPDPAQSNSWLAWMLKNPNELDLSMLASLQRSLNMMVDMIFDLDSRIIGGGARGSSEITSDGKRAQPVQLVTTFKMARHSNITTKLVYVGKGEKQRDNYVGLPVGSLHQCFMLAAHRRVEIEMAFDERHNFCYLGLKSADYFKETATKSIPDMYDSGSVRALQGGKPVSSFESKKPFKLSKTGNLQIYRTRKFQIVQRGVLESFTDSHSLETKHVSLRDKAIYLGSSSGGSPPEFLIKRIHVDYHQESHCAGAQSRSTIALTGYALIEQTNLNERAWPDAAAAQRAEDTSHEEQLSLEQCEARCMAQFECKSISFCVKGARTECTLSIVDFSEPDLMTRIKSQLQESEKEGSSAKNEKKVIQVKLKQSKETNQEEAEELSLVKQLNCAIYNKKYLQYFDSDESHVLPVLEFVSLERATSVEDCARTCFSTNLVALKSHHELLASSLEQLEQAAVAAQEGNDDNDAKAKDALAAVEQFHESGSLIKDCRGFHFFSALKLLELQSNATLAKLKRFARDNNLEERALFDNLEQLEPEGGFCVFSNKSRRPSTSEYERIPRLRFDLEENFEFLRYNFDMTSLYEEEHGVRLKSSKLSTEETSAYMDVTSHAVRKSASVRSVDIVRRLLKQGENFQTLTAGSRRVCAGLCHKQMADHSLWPACRSFDLFVEISPAGHVLVKCALNSMTKRQLIEMGRTDLIDSGNLASATRTRSLVTDYWHYEPKAGLLSERTIVAEESAISSLLKQFAANVNPGLGPYRQQLIYVFITTSIGVGLFVGLMLTEFAQSRGYLERRSQSKERARGNSISSTRALDLDSEQMELPPIPEEQAHASSNS